MILTSTAKYYLIGGAYESLNIPGENVQSNDNYTYDDSWDIIPSTISSSCNNLFNFLGHNVYTVDKQSKGNVVIAFSPLIIKSNTLAIDFSLRNYDIRKISETTSRTPTTNNRLKQSVISFKNVNTEKSYECNSIICYLSFGTKAGVNNNTGERFSSHTIYPLLSYQNFETPIIFEPEESKTFNLTTEF